MYNVHYKNKKYIVKDLGLLTKTGIKFVPGSTFQNVRRFNKRKTFQAKNRLVHLGDTPEANFLKAKSTKNTNLNRQCSFVNFCHFLSSDANVDGWVGLNLQLRLRLTVFKIDL